MLNLTQKLIQERGAALARLLKHACELDILASKPGNVSMESPGHGMSAHDFLMSADAILAPMTRPGASIGERVRDSIAATRGVVGCNTNLGIVLLCAPLTHAALSARPGQDFRGALRDSLAQLGIDDADKAYEAIRLAKPAGLGHRTSHDVAGSPTITLRDAMREVQHDDFVARQYANDFDDVFACRPLIAQLRRRWNDDLWVAVAIYLDLLARNPDSHIARKYGLDVALRVSHEAQPLSQAVLQSADPRDCAPALRAWDEALKKDGINPGTSADLTVAALYLSGILALPEFELTANGAFSPPMANQPWEQSRILAN